MTSSKQIILITHWVRQFGTEKLVDLAEMSLGNWEICHNDQF